MQAALEFETRRKLKKIKIIIQNVPNKYLYKPWELEIKHQDHIKMVVGKNYPYPIVDHSEARNAALDAFKRIKKN